MSEVLYAAACNKIDAEKALLEKVSHEIWSHPEIMYEEKYAHHMLATELENCGFKVQRHYCIPTAFRAEFSNNPGSNPVIAILCEYDALPEIGHACGHNLIAESGLAAGIGIKTALQAQPSLNGTLVVFGTPAEEGGGGKVDLIEAGAFKGIDICMMVHPAPVNLVTTPFIGILRFTVRFKGKAAHASAFPWEGRNALDAAVMCYNAVSMLRQQMKPTSRIHGVITKGGVLPNIIPSESEMKFYIRGASMGDLETLKNRLVSCFHASAQASACEMEFDASRGYKSLITNSVLGKVFRRHAEHFGVKFDDENPRGKTFIASSDVGDVSHLIPTIQPSYFIGTNSANHSEAFCTAAGSAEAQPYTLKMGKAMSMAAVDFLLKPEMVEEAKIQFEEDLAYDLAG